MMMRWLTIELTIHKCFEEFVLKSEGMVVWNGSGVIRVREDSLENAN